MRNKTERGGQAISAIPNSHGKAGHKSAQQSKRQSRNKLSSKNRNSNPPALGSPRELVAQSYQESGNGQTCARLTSLNPAKVEEIIQELSDLREELAPQVAASIPAGKRMFCTPEPIWDVSGENRADGKALLIRHPGLGWIGFLIPHDDCKRLAKKLTGKK